MAKLFKLQKINKILLDCIQSNNEDLLEFLINSIPSALEQFYINGNPFGAKHWEYNFYKNAIEKVCSKTINEIYIV